MSEEFEQDILQSMKVKLIEMCPELPSNCIHALLWYHTLLLRTGGSNKWTLRRNCGATQVIPYHPLILEALNQRVDVRIALTTEYLEADVIVFPSQLQEGAMISPAWTEISLLEFLFGVSHANYQELWSQSSVTIRTGQDQDRCFRESNEKDEETDDIFINRRDESYIIINSDLRKLYAKRPARLQRMTFAQFAISYYKKRHHQTAIIYPEYDIGDASNEPIVGGESAAPLCMKLANGIIMKKRTEKKSPVPVLLPSNILDNYGERMMFKPWQVLDELLEEDTEEEQAQMKENRLALFPMSTFPKRLTG